MPIRVVHLVAKTHLDLGFTALAAEVEQQYLEDFFPRAIAVAGELRRAAGSERLVWTTGSWILHRALHDDDADRAAAVEAAVRAGDLAWHALALTTHTELMDERLFRVGLEVSEELDARFGRTTIAAKMTDVPGHTRSMVPLLAESGVTFLHLGVNPAWPVPDVPPVFRWRSPDGAEIVVAYQAGGYGGEIVVDGCDEALAFLHSGDNLGPPSADDVRAAHAELRSRYPEAEVRASTLDAFALALVASGAVPNLPVVTAEIGDPWIFGAASDPQKLARFRHLLACRRIDEALAGREPVGPTQSTADSGALDEALLLTAEHTWGLDQKVALPEDRAWSGDALAELRSSDRGRRFEASWAEQRAYLSAAVERDGGAPHDWVEADRHEAAEQVAIWRQLLGPSSPYGAVHPVAAGEEVDLGAWTVAVDGATGALSSLVHGPTGRVLADAEHPIGVLAHQSFDEADYERFYAGLSPEPEDEWWARWDNTKPGIDACGARSAWHGAVPVQIGLFEPPHLPSLLVELAFSPDATALGAPRSAWIRCGVPVAPRAPDHAGEAPLSDTDLELEVLWLDKPATRLPEATWLAFVPAVAEPERWELDKLGQRVSPLDVVRHGGRSLHAVGEGMHYRGPDGRLTIATHHAPLVAPGRPNLLDADPPLPHLAAGFHVLLHDNCWGTNFPMWNEGAARFHFRCSIG